MIKKTITISLIALLFCSILIPSTITVTVTAEEEIKSTAGMASYLKVNWTTSNEPIMPIDDLVYVDIDIEYSITRGIALRNLFYFLVKGKQVDINLEVVDTNPWCTANIAIGNLTTQVPPKDQEASEPLTAQLSIELDKDAPAYASGFVRINISVAPIKGPFGLITFINGYEQTFTIKFKPAYLALIQAELPQGNEFEISPYNETRIPIDISNMGNARTLVDFEIVNSSKSFNITMEEILIDVDGKETAELIILADHNFKEEEIKIKITPKRAENPAGDVGGSTYITLSVKNDGSYVEEEPGLQIDVTLMTAILIIIAFVIIALILLKRKK